MGGGVFGWLAAPKYVVGRKSVRKRDGEKHLMLLLGARLGAFRMYGTDCVDRKLLLSTFTCPIHVPGTACALGRRLLLIYLPTLNPTVHFWVAFRNAEHRRVYLPGVDLPKSDPSPASEVLSRCWSWRPMYAIVGSEGRFNLFRHLSNEDELIVSRAPSERGAGVLCFHYGVAY